jgi:hypothetical protein
MLEAEELTSVLSDPRKIVATLLRRSHVSRPCLNKRSNAIAPITAGEFPELFAWFSECPSSDLGVRADLRGQLHDCGFVNLSGFGVEASRLTCLLYGSRLVDSATSPEHLWGYSDLWTRQLALTSLHSSSRQNPDRWLASTRTN